MTYPMFANSRKMTGTVPNASGVVNQKRNTLPSPGSPLPQPFVSAGPSTSNNDNHVGLLKVTGQQMRVPLTTLQLQLQLLTRSLQRSEHMPTAQVLQKLQTLNRQAARLGEIIDSSEDLMRVLQGELEKDLRPRPIDLRFLVQSAADRCAARAREQGCELRLGVAHGNAWGEWDQSRVERIVMTLLLNALQYAPRCSVVVEVHADDFRAKVEVRDNGQGISERELERLKPSRQVPRPTQSGAGVGLWLSAHLARAMGGDLTGERPAESGSLFVLTLPLARTVEAPADPAAQANQSGGEHDSDR
jgi:two-component system sensor histidine kinase AauS